MEVHALTYCRHDSSTSSGHRGRKMDALSLGILMLFCCVAGLAENQRKPL
jgi:hypothetical protein